MGLGVVRPDFQHLLPFQYRQHLRPNLDINSGQGRMGINVSGYVVDVDRMADRDDGLAGQQPPIEVLVPKIRALEAGGADGQQLAIRLVGKHIL